MFSIKNLEIITINLSNVCNMKCGICPNGHKHYYINKYALENKYKKENSKKDDHFITNFLLTKTAYKIRERLNEIKYDGLISLNGFGEPLLNPNLNDIVKCFKGFKTNIITNGIYLTKVKNNTILATINDNEIETIIDKDKIELILDNISTIEITLHSSLDYSLSAGIDNDKSYYRPFYKIQEIYGEDKIKIRNHNPYDKDNTLIFNNRNGALYDYNEICNTKNCNPNFDKLCYYPFYEIMIDSDGKYRFCAHDWNRKIDFLKDVFNCSIEDFFINDMDMIRRNIVTNNKRMENLCGQCDANGRLHGENNFIIFKKEGIKNG